MSSLKQKAKTGLAVLNESIEKAMDKQDTGLWVRLEDAQKEIDELKQKLQQLLAEFPKKRWDEIFEWRDYDDEEIDEWKKKFEVLLKERRKRNEY